MVARRDIILGIGATVGCAGATIAAVRRRTNPGQAISYPLGRPGPGVDQAVMGELACTPGQTTVAQTEGPFYSPITPLRRDIRSAFAAAAPLIVTGRVVNTMCQPIAGAVLDFWQTGDEGDYDNQGYGYRGHQFTDADGRFQLTTIRPAQYTAMNTYRSPHIHAKVQGAGTSLLTTQLYLPDELEANARDGIYVPSMLVKFIRRSAGAQVASFDFVLAHA
jgi:protocatechuate 3,4-dioxygenase beta subunit